MANIGGRHCIRYKNVQTGGGASRRVCAKYGELSEDVEHSGMFGDLGKLVPKALSGSTDTLVGAAIGLAGVAAVKLGLGYAPSVSAMLPDFVKKGLPALGGTLGAVAAYAFTRNKVYALSAFGTGVALNAWDLLSTQFPALGSLVTYSIPGYQGYGMLQPERMQPGQPGLQGYAALIDDPRPGMSELAMMGYGDEEDNAP